MSAGRLVLAVPGDPEQRTGGYLYDRRLAEGLRAIGWRVDLLRLPEGFPFPDAAALRASAAALGGLPDGTLVVVDGLALGALPELACAEAGRLRLVALVHHPLGHEEGLAPEAAARLLASERRALAAVPRVLCTSTTTAATLEREFGVPAERIAVVEPGTDPAPVAPGSGGPTPRLLAVGSVIPRKRLDRLVLALGRLGHLAWRLEIVGSLARSREAARALAAAIEDAGLGERVERRGELLGRELEQAYARADLFVSASAYEGYGMALAEALARGLPIVAAAGGAVADWLPKEAALLVPADDPLAFEAALARAIGDPALRARLREGALAARARLPTWERQAARAAAILAREAAR